MKALNVLLLRPPHQRLKGYHPMPYFPLGLGYIGAVLERAGHTVRIWNIDIETGIAAGVNPDDLTVLRDRAKKHEQYLAALKDDRHPVWAEVREVLRRQAPDVVGISVLTGEVGAAEKLSALVKEWKRDVVVVWGGHHPTFLPDDVLSYGPVDVVVRGEGEETAVELMAALADGGAGRLREVRGISFVEGGKIVHNPDRDLIADLDAIPMPAHHLALFPEAYRRIERIGMMTNRGCPFRCGYCSSPQFTRRHVRYRSWENILAEIRHVTRFYHTNVVSFLDDNFTIDRDKVLNLCERLIASDLRVSWTTMTRADILTEDVVRLLKRAGCCDITIGIESGSPRVLKEQIRKGVDLDKVVGAYDLLDRYGIPSGANFIIGFPEETEEDIAQTFAVMKSIRTVNMNCNVFEPIPGSPLLEVSERLGLMPRPVDWRTFGFWPMHHFVKAIPPERFSETVWEIFRWVHRQRTSLGVRWRKMKPYLKNDPLYPVKKVAASVRVRVLRRILPHE